MAQFSRFAIKLVERYRIDPTKVMDILSEAEGDDDTATKLAKLATDDDKEQKELAKKFKAELAKADEEDDEEEDEEESEDDAEYKKTEVRRRKKK